MWEKRRKGAGHLRLTVVTNLLDPESLPPHCVYILADTDDDGRVMAIDKAGSGWHRPYYLPEKARLIICDPNGGFVTYEQDESGDEHAFWSMKRAPEDGYVQELVLDADWLFRRSPQIARRGPEAGIYFYFKVDNMFGKGRIDGVELIDGGYGMRLAATFRLQMDGTRNVDTGRR